MKEFSEINEALDGCCQLALRQRLPGKQVVLLTNANFQAAWYVVLIEDDPNQKNMSTCKANAPIAYSSKTYTPFQIKMSIYAKDFRASYLAFNDVRQYFREQANQWLLWLTANQSPDFPKQKGFLHPYGMAAILYYNLTPL